jgi:hypothetical protein
MLILLLAFVSLAQAISREQIPPEAVFQEVVREYLPLANVPIITPMRPLGGFKVLLSMDGGGIRGIIPQPIYNIYHEKL